MTSKADKPKADLTTKDLTEQVAKKIGASYNSARIYLQTHGLYAKRIEQKLVNGRAKNMFTKDQVTVFADILKKARGTKTA